MPDISPVTRGRPQARRGWSARRTVWYLMRITGLALFVLALAHFSILHFIYDPAQQTAEFIASQRWNQFFWRAIDWTAADAGALPLVPGHAHGVPDYIHGRAPDDRPGRRSTSSP